MPDVRKCLKKKSNEFSLVQDDSFKDDDDNDDNNNDDNNDNDDAKVCTVLSSGKERRAKNDDKWAFSCAYRRRCDSQNLSGAHAGSSRVIGTFRN